MALKKIKHITTLTLLNRMVIPAILPTEGGFTQMIIVRALKKKVEITPKEIKDFQIRDFKVNNIQQLAWDLGKRKDAFDYELNEAERKQIRDALQKKCNDNKISEDLLDLCEQFKVTEKTDEK